jgi:hypothetical protein
MNQIINIIQKKIYFYQLNNFNYKLNISYYGPCLKQQSHTNIYIYIIIGIIIGMIISHLFNYEPDE